MIRPKITITKVNFYLRQQYGFKNMEKFFEYAQLAPKTHHQAIAGIIREFTGYRLVKGKLQTLNPYTSKYESLEIKGFGHIKTPRDIMKELSMLHKTRMNMLKQSRKRILELSKLKKNSRDKDLEGHSEVKKNQRLNELKTLDKSQEKEVER